jgi:hypothetical protein
MPSSSLSLPHSRIFPLFREESAHTALPESPNDWPRSHAVKEQNEFGLSDSGHFDSDFLKHIMDHAIENEKNDSQIRTTPMTGTEGNVDRKKLAPIGYVVD